MIKYNACDYFMIRTPLLSLAAYLDLYSELDNIDDRLIALFNSSLEAEALFVASKDLSEALERTGSSRDSKAYKQVISSLTKYFIRLSTRPTPFGLFSGISIGHFGDSTNIVISDLSQHKKRARPDMDWIYGIIKKMEADKNIRKNLCVRFNDFTYANGNRLEKPSSSLLQHSIATENVRESTSIRYTAQVKNIESKSKDFCLFSNIIDELVSKNAEVPYERIDRFLSQLLENEYLLSELRPPLINADVLDYIINILSGMEGIEEAEHYISSLLQIRKTIHEYNSTRIGEGIGLYREAIHLMKELFESRTYLQVDMKTHTDRNMIDSGLKEELEQFVSAIYDITPHSIFSNEILQYQTLFLEKYGYNVEIPVLELLDEDMGLGVPANYTTAKAKREAPVREKGVKEQRLIELMDRKIVTALKEGKKIVEITENDIEFIRKQEESIIYSDTAILNSFELYLLAHPGVLGTEDEADYYFTVAPVTASFGIGKTFGRFHDLLDEEESLLLKNDIEKQKNSFLKFVVAEISELPSKGGISNVSINKSYYDYQISLGTNPTSDKHILSIRDLYIGMNPNDNTFYIKSKSLNKKVIVTMTCMLNSMNSSSTLRFLCEISSMHMINPINSIALILNSRFEYIPRITYGKIIINPETWIISRNILEMIGNGKSDFDLKLTTYRERHRIPKYIFMHETDNRLLLDLENPVHRNEVYGALKKDAAYQVKFTEVGCQFSDYVSVNSSKEHYVTEIVVPFILNRNTITFDDGKENDNTKTLSDISQNCIMISRDELTLLPGKGNWLYFKLYGCSKRQDELLPLIYLKLEELSSSIEKYYFIRYADPDPHIRLRIHFKEGMVSALFPYLSEWFETLRLDGYLSKITIDSYLREAERYGGTELIELAEEYFFHDSRMAIQLINKMRYEQLQIDKDIIGVSFISSALDVFKLSDNDKRDFLNARSNKNEYRKQFQENRKLLIKAVNSSNHWHDISSREPYTTVYPPIIEASLKLREYAEAVYLYDNKSKLTNSLPNIISSIIHMFCNRLIGDNMWEHRVYALASHSFHALQGFLKHQHHLPL